MTSWVRLTMSGTLAGWIGLASASASAEVAAPDSAQRTELRERLSTGMARVIGPFGAREVPHPVLDSIGINSADWLAIPRQRPALFTGAGVQPRLAPPPIEWRDIDEVQSGRPMTGRGFTIGLLSGLALSSWVIVLARNTQSEAALGLVGVVIVTPVITSFFGAAIGASHANWHTVYRSQ